ncbi:MAG: SDR family oxidoreductase [Candidatus Korobacteraceae bacterium]
MADYLVTGVAGFIGRSIAAELLKRGERVRGIDNFSTGKRENVAGLEQMELMEADIKDASACQAACRGMDIVFHQAALASVPRSVLDPVTTNENNVSGTLQLLLAARDAKVRRFVFAGSSSVYGDSPTLPKHEGMPPNPISPYAVSKLAGELYLKAFYSVYGLEGVVLRYFNVFGPYQDPSSMYSGVLAKFSLNMLRGEAPTVFGDGEQSRDFTYIENVVRGNLLAAHAPAAAVAGTVMNVATGSRITLNDTVKLLRELTGYSGEVKHGPERAGDIKHSLADITLAGKRLGYAPQVDFREGLRRTVEWYKTIMADEDTTAR